MFICNHGILHKITELIYQCMSCKEEFEVDAMLPPINQQGNVITEWSIMTRKKNRHDQEIKKFWENKLIMVSEYYKQLFAHANG